jgi:hypothetical protein
MTVQVSHKQDSRGRQQYIKYNGVTRYCLCHETRAITFRSDNDSNFDRVITLGCVNGSIELEAITFLQRGKAL